MTIINWKHETRKVSQLREWDKNPRKLTDKGITKLKESLEKFGVAEPIVINQDNVICGGHGRLKALKQLGVKEVPVYVAELTDKEFEELNIRLNKNIAGEWDFDILANEFEQQELLDWGFEEEEFGIKETLNEGLTDEDAAPDAPVEPVTKLGDIWLLGNHRLMCGDSAQIDAVEKLMAGAKADMVFTDPPYRIETEGGCKGEVGKSLQKQGKEIEFISEFSPKEFLQILPNCFQSKKLNAYIFCNKDLLPDYLMWAKKFGVSFNVLVWKKPNAIPIGGSHRPDIEYLLLFRQSAIWNGALKDVNYSRLIECQRESGLHPTMKPVEMIENQVKISSNANSIVLDLFGGSGSTLIACEKTNRHARLMELDPKYCDVIIKRWQEFTGKEAILEGTDKTYNLLTLNGQQNGLKTA